VCCFTEEVAWNNHFCQFNGHTLHHAKCASSMTICLLIWWDADPTLWDIRWSPCGHSAAGASTSSLLHNSKHIQENLDPINVDLLTHLVLDLTIPRRSVTLNDASTLKVMDMMTFESNNKTRRVLCLSKQKTTCVDKSQCNSSLVDPKWTLLLAPLFASFFSSC